MRDEPKYRVGRVFKSPWYTAVGAESGDLRAQLVENIGAANTRYGATWFGKYLAKLGSPREKTSERNGCGFGKPRARIAAGTGFSLAREAVPHGGDICTYDNKGEESSFHIRAWPDGTVRSTEVNGTLVLKRFPAQSIGKA